MGLTPFPQEFVVAVFTKEAVDTGLNNYISNEYYLYPLDDPSCIERYQMKYTDFLVTTASGASDQFAVVTGIDPQTPLWFGSLQQLTKHLFGLKGTPREVMRNGFQDGTYLDHLGTVNNTCLYIDAEALSLISTDDIIWFKQAKTPNGSCPFEKIVVIMETKYIGILPLGYWNALHEARKFINRE